jgi:hypothetical protein
MKNNKLLIVLLSVLLVSLTGCGGSKMYYVECDSGFKTTLSSRAYSEDGIISWRADELGAGNFYHTRKMNAGESCLTKMVIVD